MKTQYWKVDKKTWELVYEGKTPKGKLQILRGMDIKAEFFWRTIAKNGREIQRSTETFHKLQGCLRDLQVGKMILTNILPVEAIAQELNVKI